MLTKDQQQALEVLKGDENVFLTGAAGTGKSYLLKYYREFFNKKIPVVCSTGVAAVLVGGRTFHSYFGLGIMSSDEEIIIATAMSNPALVGRIKRAKEIIIDEISMLSGEALNVASEICKRIRNNGEAFGGIRIICVGDFYQLPPVQEDRKKGKDWAFKSKAWHECDFRSIELTQIMRTKEVSFLRFLYRVRQGYVGPDEKKFLQEHLIEDKDSFEGTRIFSRKKMVSDFNESKLAELPGKEYVFDTDFDGTESHVFRLMRSLPIETSIRIKAQSLIMIRINDQSKEKLYVNGTLGHVVAISDSELMIKTLDRRFINLKKHTFTLKDGDGETVASALNFPISLAYAVTIHKSQGATIDHALVDLYNLWDSGQAYTALSRLASEKGLKILQWNARSVFVDEEVKRFYQLIRAQAKKV